MKKQILFLFCLTFAAISADIIDVQRFSEITSHITPDTLVLLDIDDTLLIPDQMLGCDDWFQGRWDKYKQEGMSRADALEKSLAEWEAVRHLTKMKIVEPGTDTLVKQLQEKGYCIMGLTTQGIALATRTKQQLSEHNFDLSVTAPFKFDHYLRQNNHGVLYRDGILFTSGTAKGDALFHLCDSNGFCPKKIVFINDKATHLADVENIAKKRNVPFTGLRYAYADKHKSEYRPEIADIQFTHSTFVKLLTDEEAAALQKALAEPCAT